MAFTRWGKEKRDKQLRIYDLERAAAGAQNDPVDCSTGFGPNTVLMFLRTLEWTIDYAVDSNLDLGAGFCRAQP